MKLSLLNKKVHGGATFALGLLLLLGVNKARVWMKGAAFEAERDLQQLRKQNNILDEGLNELRALRNLKTRDLDQFKAGLSGLADSKRALYEAGLSLQEERRMLENLKDIMTTYLQVDEEKKKVLIMRGEQALMDYPSTYPAGLTLGGEQREMPQVAQIVSKERFAHPERGKSEQAEDGTLVWNPPQVGQSARSNALGEYVMFTNGPLILHGPPKKAAEHEAFPHVCLGLSLRSAQKLYSNSYIGTRIAFKKAPADAPLPIPSTRN